MKIIKEIYLKKSKVDCGPPIGPALAPYGLDINKVVAEINSLIVEKKITDKITIEIDLDRRNYEIILSKPKTSELLKTFSKDNKISYINLVKAAKMNLQNNNIQMTPESLETEIKRLRGTCRSMHLEILK